METNEFIRLVEATLLNVNGRTASRREILQTIRANLKTLGEMLPPEQIQQLAATLPPEIGNYLLQTETSEYDTLEDFFHSVAEREETTLPGAIHHSRTVIAALQEVVPADVLQMIREKLPGEFAPLFQ
jgi:uncharacterized protein (DUF2267 family)